MKRESVPCCDSHIPHSTSQTRISRCDFEGQVAHICPRAAADFFIASHHRIVPVIVIPALSIRTRTDHAQPARAPPGRHTTTKDDARLLIFIQPARGKPLRLRRQTWWKTSTWRLRAGPTGPGTNAVDRYIGLMLAVSSSLAIGTSAPEHVNVGMLTVYRREFCHHEEGPKCVHGEAWLRRRRLRIPAKPCVVGGHNNE